MSVAESPTTAREQVEETVRSHMQSLENGAVHQPVVIDRRIGQIEGQGLAAFLSDLFESEFGIPLVFMPLKDGRRGHGGIDIRNHVTQLVIVDPTEEPLPGELLVHRTE